MDADQKETQRSGQQVDEPTKPKNSVTKAINIVKEFFHSFGEDCELSIAPNESKFYLNPELNGSTVSDFRCTQDIGDEEVLQEFYLISDTTVPSHGFVIAKTNLGNSLICHLVGLPGSLVVEIKLDQWSPTSEVQQSTHTLAELKIFLRAFDCVYQLGTQDCRHFAALVGSFLTTHKHN